MKKYIICLLIFLFIGSAGLLLYMYGDNLSDYIKSSKEYADIQKDNTSPRDIIIPDDASYDLKTLLEDPDYACIDVDSQRLKQQNKDYIGWIYIPKTKISYPVVKSLDNNDYLHKSFKKAYSFSGTVFLDCRNEGNINKGHSVLYGHNMKNGSMFAGLKKFTKKNYLDSHAVFWFIDASGNKMLFKIFSVEKPAATDPFTYNCFNYLSETDSWTESLQKIYGRSLVDTGIYPDQNDTIMSLSTCTGYKNTRCVVHGTLVSVVFSKKDTAAK